MRAYCCDRCGLLYSDQTASQIEAVRADTLDLCQVCSDEFEAFWNRTPKSKLIGTHTAESISLFIASTPGPQRPATIAASLGFTYGAVYSSLKHGQGSRFKKVGKKWDVLQRHGVEAEGPDE